MIMNFKRFPTWLREIILWAAEAWLVFLCFLVILATFLFGFCIWPSEQSIRIAGYVLQILGILFAIRGLLNIRAHFSQPTLRKLFIAWLYRFPKWEKDTVISVVDGFRATASMRARAEVWSPDNTEVPLEKRIDRIIKNIERIREEQKIISEQIDKLQENHEKSQKEQEQARVNVENNFRAELESLHTSDIIVSLVGLIWLIFGISMSTMSQELSKIVQ